MLITSVLSRRGVDKPARSHRESGEAAVQVQLRIHPGRLQHVRTADGSNFDNGDLCDAWQRLCCVSGTTVQLLDCDSLTLRMITSA